MEMKEYKLWELIKIKNGKDHKNLNEGDNPVFGSGGIIRYVDSFLYNKPSVLLPRKGTLNNIQYADKPFWTVDTIYYTEVNDSKVNAYYLYNYLKLLDLSNLDSGTGVPSMTFDSYYNLSVKLPSLELQNRIAAILSSIDKKISLNREINRNLEELAKQIYDYWFVQFDFPNEEGKPYKSSGGKMVYNEILKREIPAGWEVKPLKNCIKHINTGLNPRDNFMLGTGNIKYVTVKNLAESGEIDFSNCDLIDEEARSMIHNRSDIKIGDILYSSICPLGRCYFINEEPKNWDINESVFTIRPNYKDITSQFLYGILRDDYYVKKITQKATGSIFKGIRVNDLEKIEIVLPTKKIVDLFTIKITSILNEQTKLQNESMKLNEMRDKLLPLLMNGQVTLK